ncbi:MAG TPA: hypothetical protein VLF43_00635 [Candidatus Saccharimonadales bacterium]|nr:hypothetical protein [Candidatus Saccharimonadales bacterium]
MPGQFTSTSEHLEVVVSHAEELAYLIPAVVISRRVRGDKGPYEPRELSAEVDRAREGLSDYRGHRPVGALAIMRGGLHDGEYVAYAYAAEQYESVGEHPVCLRSVCVDPDFRGYGLSGAVASEALQPFYSRRRYQDCVSAVGILLTHEFETQIPSDLESRNFKGPTEYYKNLFAGTPLSTPPEDAPALPPNPTVANTIETIRASFPNMPTYTVTDLLSRT